jgi:hypothetical protein
VLRLLRVSWRHRLHKSSLLSLMSRRRWRSLLLLSLLLDLGLIVHLSDLDGPQSNQFFAFAKHQQRILFWAWGPLEKGGQRHSLE